MTLQTKQKIFIASLMFRVIRIARKLAGKNMTGQFSRGSFTWHLDLNEVVDFMIYLSGSFEGYLSRFIARNLAEGDIAMDIGANIGAHTLTMGKCVGSSGQAFAIEATEYAYLKLVKNIQLNPELDGSISPNHTIFAAEDTANEGVKIHSSWPFETDSERHTSHQGIFKSTGSAPITSLDTFVIKHDIKKLDLIKLDVDGNEHDVLSGGQTTLKTMQPTIIMEVAPDYHQPNHEKGFHSIHSLLTNLDYIFYSFSGSKLPDNPDEFAAMIPKGASHNVVIIPKGKLPPKF